jgi:hypothetical protein
MPNVTRRRSDDRPDCWHIYCGNVQAGTNAKRVGNPYDTDPWEWSCGFYPGSHPRKISPAPPPALLRGHVPRRVWDVKNGDLG